MSDTARVRTTSMKFEHTAVVQGDPAQLIVFDVEELGDEPLHRVGICADP